MKQILLWVCLPLAIASAQTQSTTPNPISAASMRPYWVGISVPDADASASTPEQE